MRNAMLALAAAAALGMATTIGVLAFGVGHGGAHWASGGPWGGGWRGGGRVAVVGVGVLASRWS